MSVFRRAIAFQTKFIYYSSLLLGVYPILYNSKEHRISRCRILEFYSLFIHGTAFLAANILGYKMKLLYGGNLVTKDFVLFVDVFTAQIRILSGLLSMFVFHKNCSNFVCFTNNILKLDSTCFKDSKGWFIFMVFLKMFFTGSIGWMHVSIILQNVPVINWLTMAVFSSTCAMITFHMFSVLYFYIAVGCLTKFFGITNENLEQVYQDYKFQRTSADQVKTKVEELTKIYSELFHLHTFLIKVYEIQIVSALVTNFVGNVSAGFTTYTLYHSEHVNWFAFGTYFILTIANYLDSYLTSVMCNKNCQLWRTATEILGQFTILKSNGDDGDRGLDRAVSLYILIGK